VTKIVVAESILSQFFDLRAVNIFVEEPPRCLFGAHQGRPSLLRRIRAAHKQPVSKNARALSAETSAGAGVSIDIATATTVCNSSEAKYSSRLSSYYFKLLRTSSKKMKKIERYEVRANI
jgi:hypothetical protein